MIGGYKSTCQYMVVKDPTAMFCSVGQGYHWGRKWPGRCEEERGPITFALYLFASFTSNGTVFHKPAGLVSKREEGWASVVVKTQLQGGEGIDDFYHGHSAELGNYWPGSWARGKVTCQVFGPEAMGLPCLEYSNGVCVATTVHLGVALPYEVGNWLHIIKYPGVPIPSPRAIWV